VRGKLFGALTPEQRSQLHRRNARRFVRTASKLKGANVKLGQLASMQAHLLPIEYITELKTLRDAVQPTEYARIAALIEAELGQRPQALFASFNEQPIAAASMAQVYVATLKSGEKVVVKVLHPGLERSVAIDMALLGFLFRRLKNAWKRVDLDVILRESEEPLRRELDLRLEAKATEQLGAELAPLGVIVPKVHWELSSQRVLTLEFIEGVNVDKVAQLEQWKVDRPALAGTYIRSFMHQAFVTGTFHADPHPGNTFCTPDGRLALLDFGMVKQLPDHVRQGLLKELFGSFFNNPRLYVDGLIEKGALGERERGVVLERARGVCGSCAARAHVRPPHRRQERGRQRSRAFARPDRSADLSHAVGQLDVHARAWHRDRCLQRARSGSVTQSDCDPGASAHPQRLHRQESAVLRRARGGLRRRVSASSGCW
jgi:predicted unusual protein kinase regulating ubiquinone biosynthesis (AarF/ABC1/UbiB family)